MEGPEFFQEMALGRLLKGVQLEASLGIRDFATGRKASRQAQN